MSSSSSSTYQNFGLTLHKLLKEHRGRACGWIDNGLSFAIFDVSLFLQEVLPLHFGDITLNKFAQLLSLHGFKRGIIREPIVDTSDNNTDMDTNTDGANGTNQSTCKTTYTFTCARFTRDAKPSELVKIRRQSTHISRMKRILSETSKDIIDSKSQMQETQRTCLALIQHIKSQLKVYDSVKEMILMEETPSSNNETYKSSTSSSSSTVPDESSLVSHLKLMEPNTLSPIPNDIEMYNRSKSGA